MVTCLLGLMVILLVPPSIFGIFIQAEQLTVANIRESSAQALETYALFRSYQIGGVAGEVSLSADGNYIIAGSEDNKIYFFGAQGGSLWTCKTGDKVYGVSVSDDGNYVVAGSYDNKIYFFNKEGKLLWSYTTGGRIVHGVSVSANGSYVVAGSGDNKVYFFNRDGNLLWSHGPYGLLYDASVSADGNYVAVGSWGVNWSWEQLSYNNIYFLDREGKLLWSYQAHTTGLSVSVSSNGSYVAAGSRRLDNRVYLFERDGKVLWNYTIGSDVYSVSVSPDGNYIAVGSNKVYLFNKQGRLVWSYGTGNEVYGVCVSPNGGYIAAASGSKIYVFGRPRFPLIITVTPSVFALTPGESTTLTATLTDSLGRPLPDKTIGWGAGGDPLFSGTLKTNYLPTDYAGRSFAIYTAGEVPCETSVRASAWFYEESSGQSSSFSTGKVSPNPPLTIPLLIFGVLLPLTRALSQKGFRRTLITIFIFGFSFILSYPLGFSFSFQSLVLSAKVPAWFLAGLFFLITAAVSLSVLEQSSKYGLAFGICCWTGTIFGLLLPNSEVEIGKALLATSTEGLMLSGVLATLARLSRWIRIRKLPPLPKPISTAPPLPTASPGEIPTSRQVLPIPSIKRAPIKWPNIEDYKICFQSLQHFMLDQDLKNGVVEVDRWGLPKAVSGRYGCVFKVEHGNKFYAAKCYILQTTDMEKRYEQISRYLNKVNLPFFVEFAYIPKGILVQGESYPILKMDWVEGKRLDKFITDNVHDANLLKGVAETIIDCIIELQRNQIAHGDLHHENLKVIPNDKDNMVRLLLIDYDGIYVPKFSGENSPELGHPNYQHPRRAEKHYDLRLDNFPCLVVYLSLLGIAENPQLWEKYHDDECMILTQEDFKNPQKSKAIQELLESPSQKVQKLANLLLEALSDDPLSDRIRPEHLKKI